MEKHDLSHKLTLYTCCALLSLTQPLGAWHVVPLLASAVGVGLLTFYADSRRQLVVAGVFFAACVLYWPLCAFIPAVIYETYSKQRRFIILGALVPLPAASSLGYMFLLSVAILAGLAVLLKHRTLSFAELRAHYLSLLDTTRAMTEEIRQQHKLLLERQDDEIRLARLSERNRIAREIHDHVGHRLASAVLQLGAMLTLQPEQRGLMALKDTLSAAMDDIRSSVHNLYESSIDLTEHLAQAAGSLTSCRVQHSIHLESEPSMAVKYAFIAAAKEACANIAKHSDATLVRITLTEHTSFYQLIIADNGSAPSADYGKGIGLKSIAARIEALSGQFLVRTNHGFEIFITVPKEAAGEATRSR